MSGSPVVTSATDDRLIDYIAARERLVYVAPGVSERVAEALSASWHRLGAEAVIVIVDVHPEVCRLGLGTLEGLEVKHEGHPVITEAALRKRRKKIVDNFLYQLPGFGSVVLRANRDAFDAAVKGLRDDVDAFSAGVRQRLDERIKKSVDTVVHALFPAVKPYPPPRYRKAHGPSPRDDDDLRTLLKQDVESAFGTAEGLVRDMRVSLVFKEVAYESLVDERFLEAARDHMPGGTFPHEEFDAAAAAEEGEVPA